MNIKHFPTINLFALTFVCLATSSACGIQDAQIEETANFGLGISTQDGPMVISSFGSSVDGGPMVMQIEPSFGSIGGLGGAGFPTALPGVRGALSLLRDSDIQKEIELAGKQLQEYQEMQKSLQAAINERMGDIRSGKFDPERMKDLGKLIGEITEEHQDRMEKLLLPHQLDRLKQIALQRYLQQTGEANALTSQQLAEELGITPEQQERLKRRSEEISKTLKEKIEDLKQKAQEELLRELTPSQRQQFKEMVGQKYEFQTSNDLSERIKRLRDSRNSSNEQE